MNAYDMMVKAGLDWKIGKEAAYLDIDGTRIKCGRESLYRYREKRNENGEIIRVPLDEFAMSDVGDKWNLLQNEEFVSYVDSWAGRNHFKIHSMGCLDYNTIVYVVVDVDSGFTLFSGKDVISSYFVFSLFHKYGKAIDIRFDQIRRISGARFSLSIRHDKNFPKIRINHRRPFDLYQQLKEPLTYAHFSMNHYKERAELLTRRKFTEETVRKFFNDVFPPIGRKPLPRSIFHPEIIPLSLSAGKIFDNLFTQPGAELSPHSWWSALNAVFFTMDFKLGHRQSTREVSAMYGDLRERKLKALELALEYALGNR